MGSDKNHTRLGSMTEIESHSSVMYDPMHACACAEMSFLVTGHKIICYMYLKKRVESLNLGSQKGVELVAEFEFISLVPRHC